MTLKDEAIPVPMFWTNETMKLDEETTEDVYNNSVFPMKVKQFCTMCFQMLVTF